jgi:kelch-like protein 9/13
MSTRKRKMTDSNNRTTSETDNNQNIRPTRSKSRQSNQENATTISLMIPLVNQDEEDGQIKLLKTDDYSSNLLKQLNSMRNDRSLCDYEIRVNGESFSCHKCILIAISDFFRLMLTTNMKESKQDFVELKGFNTTQGIRLIVEYFYTGKLEISDPLSFSKNILSILDAASQLQIPQLLELCSNYLIKNVNISNCVSILKLSERYALLKAIDHCKLYVCENIIEIFKNSFEQFSQLSVEHVKHILQSDLVEIYSELDLFHMIVKWLEQSEDNDNNGNDDEARRIDRYAFDLMKSIRFMCITPEELCDHVEKVAFMKSLPECYSLLASAYRYHALPKRQPLIQNEMTRMRNKDVLVSVGEQNLYILNESKQDWETICDAPLEDNYRKDYSYNLTPKFNFFFLRKVSIEV